MRRIVAVVVVCLAAACSAGEPGLDVDDGPLVYVPMGDSLTFSPEGSSLIDGYAEMLEEDFGVTVDRRAYSVANQRADDFLTQLQSNDTLRADLTEADVITFLIPIGEWAEPLMIFAGVAGHDRAECGGADDQQCLRDMVANYNITVDEVFEELMSIVDLSEQVVLVQDVYQLHTERQGDTTQALYPYFRAAQVRVQETAAAHGVPVASVWDDFMGADGEIPNLIEAGLIQTDGVHPTEDGALRIATLFHDLGYDLGS
jgi:lysophospholipase L1-like esterase